MSRNSKLTIKFFLNEHKKDVAISEHFTVNQAQTLIEAQSLI